MNDRAKKTKHRQNMMLREKVAQLGEALHRYGQHETDCVLVSWGRQQEQKQLGNELECSCGLDKSIGNIGD
jgi:hypothetical protein